jgi:hypothetical protein
MDRRYVVLYFTEDGDVLGDTLAETELLNRLDTGHWGKDPHIATALPRDLSSYVGLLILRGPCVVPVAKQVTTRHTIED